MTKREKRQAPLNWDVFTLVICLAKAARGGR